MSNRNTLQAAIDEDDRKKRALMAGDMYNLDCSRTVPSTPFAEEADNGNRARRADEKVSDPVNKPARAHSHYFKDVSKLSEVDVYRVCSLFGVDDQSGATHHAIKKLLLSGKRGAKDQERDIREAIDTMNRRLQMIAEDCN